jgi:putative flippase GtrA
MSDSSSRAAPRMAGIVRQMFSFGLVGVLGFVVDAGVLYVGLYCGLGLYAGRAVSYMSAVSATWVLNRRYTFERTGGHNRLHEWARFVVSQLSGATINLGMYALLVHMSPLVARYPIIGVAVGSLSGLLVNFSVARAYVFYH